MTDKITLTNLVNLQNQTTAVNAINTNNAVITAAFDNTLSLDGTQPNSMSANLDMNSNHILNLPAPTSSTEPVRYGDLTTFSTGGTLTFNNVPTGGTTGQVLTKNSGTNYDTGWSSVTTTNGLPTGGTTGQVLTKNSSTNYDASWLTPTVSSGVTTEVPVYATLADAQASNLSNSIQNVIIVRKAAGNPAVNAPFVRGTSTGPNAFQDAGSNYWQIDTSGNTIKAGWFWAGLGSDDTSALNAMFAVGKDKIYDLGSGNYNIASALNMPDHCTIRGDSFDSCSITISGSNEITHGMLYGYNVSGITIEGITFNGNGISTTSGSIGAIYINDDNTATQAAASDGLCVQKCKFYNFKQDHWVSIQSGTNATINFGDVHITDNVFVSVNGNSRSYSDYNNGSTMIYLWGNTTLSTGALGDIWVQRNRADGTGVLCFLAIWVNTGQYMISDNNLQNFSYYATGTPNNYNIFIYSPNSNQCAGGIITRNYMYNNVNTGSTPACGIYCAQTLPVVITDNVIYGINRTDESTLRRAAISLNGVGGSVVSGNLIQSCYLGIAISGDALQLITDDSGLNLGRHLVIGNQISSGIGSSSAFNITWTNNSTYAPYVYVAYNLTNVNASSTFAAGTYGTINQTGNV